jgi:hypothetical protein
MLGSTMKVVTLYLGSRLKADLITSTPYSIQDPTSEAASICYHVLEWGEGTTNIPDSRDDVPLT